MAIYDKINRDEVFAYGEENAVASVHTWFQSLFRHGSGYDIFFDKDQSEFTNRTAVVFPSINIVQVDSQDVVSGAFGGGKNMMNLLFYIYFNHHIAAGGSRRLLRRGRDQISYALKMAGVMDKITNTHIVPPIYMYDFSKNPMEKLGVISVSGGVQQRFIQDGELLQYEFVVPMKYMELLGN